VRCEIVDAAQASKPRSITEEQARTWTGMEYASTGQIKAGADNPPSLVGFAIEGPAILLGTPEDNPLIGFLERKAFLPFKSARDEFPGRGRGMIAWQRDGIGREQESVALIAYDADGMAEAVGSMYEAAIGMDPLTPCRLPSGGEVTAASNAHPGVLGPIPPAEVAWQLETTADGSRIIVGASQRIITFSSKGKKLAEVPVAPDPEPPAITWLAVAAGTDVHGPTRTGGTRMAACTDGRDARGGLHRRAGRAWRPAPTTAAWRASGRACQRAGDRNGRTQRPPARPYSRTACASGRSRPARTRRTSRFRICRPRSAATARCWLP